MQLRMELSGALGGTTYGRGRDPDAGGPWAFRVAGRSVGRTHNDERGDLAKMKTITDLVAVACCGLSGKVG